MEGGQAATVNPQMTQMGAEGGEKAVQSSKFKVQSSRSKAAVSIPARRDSRLPWKRRGEAQCRMQSVECRMNGGRIGWPEIGKTKSVW